MPLRTVHVSVAFPRGRSLRSKLFYALGIVDDRAYFTGHNLFALDLPGLRAAVAATLAALSPFALHPSRRTGLLAAGLRILRLELRIAEAVVHRSVVPPSNARHSPGLVT